MRAATDVQGNPEFLNPGRALQQTVRAAEQARKSNGPGAGTSAGGTGNQGGSEPVRFRNDTTPPGIDPDSGLPLDSNRQPMEPQAAVLDGLSRIAGVASRWRQPRAVASEMPKLLNEDQTELLARMWSGQDRQYRRCRRSRRSIPMHRRKRCQRQSPMIGIRSLLPSALPKGRALASGGYTQAYYGHRDPGDGNYNRGTVSGGRGNRLTPEQVDQRWMSRLSKHIDPCVRRIACDGTAAARHSRVQQGDVQHPRSDGAGHQLLCRTSSASSARCSSKA